uniref:Olfactomedin-like 2Ba n=1 Tax=Neogobius melanostomus TaxID=47308 RepID=A0A8C6T345_9GOBI
MYRLCVVVFACSALLKQCSSVPRRSRSADAKSEYEHHRDPLQEVQGREDLLSELLGDYDKVKALSEGSDCRCKCVVRPLSRSACQRIEAGHARADDFYTVETITSGPECKCACIAPPSAVNPCDGEFRLKKLREAGKENVKLSTILDLLEGSFYGMDLLKLHSVTTKLLERVDHIEKAVLVNTSHSETKPQQSPPLADEIQSLPTQSLPEWQDEKMSRDEVHRSDIKSEVKCIIRQPLLLLLKTFLFLPVFEYDGFSGEGPINLFIEENLLQHKSPRPRTRSGQRTFRSKSERHFSDSQKMSQSLKSKVRKTDHEAKIPSELTTTLRIASTANSRLGSQKDTSKKHSQWQIDLTDEPRGTSTSMSPVQSPGPTATIDSFKAFLMNRTMTETSDRSPKDKVAESTPGNPTSARPTTTSTTVAPTSYTTLQSSSTLSTPASKDEILEPVSTQLLTSLTPYYTSQPSATLGTTPPSAATTTTTTTTLSTTTATKSVSPEPQKKKDDRPYKRKPADCKDTLATISEPITQNTYGKSEGAWMKDPKSNNDKIYVTNYFYGNNLLEFANLEIFKQGHFTNSYKLPYNWIGTGHVVYGGAFYFNRAFSQDIIKFDLHNRYVAAWTMLHDAIFEESSTPWEWRSYSDINIAVDESGLWIIYPALDNEGFFQEVVVLSRLDPVDLSMERETTWKTGLRRNQYGNCFIVCGVLYFVDSYSRREANLEYAFDTHTNTQMIPRMPFTNNYTYTTQLGYNPREGVLYGWDNGHQVTYNTKFAYVEP